MALVLFGAGAFVLLLWMLGAGLASGSANDGGNHAEGRGLNGFAALYRMLEEEGYPVSRTRTRPRAQEGALLVLTPPFGAEAAEITETINRHRLIGPVLLIVPKWMSIRIPEQLARGAAKPGWVMLGEPRAPDWSDRLGATDTLDLQINPLSGRAALARWQARILSGALPQSKAGQSFAGRRYVPLVEDARGRMLAGYLDDGGRSPALVDLALAKPNGLRGSSTQPLLVVSEPDLLNNYGLSRAENAQLALRLVDALASDTQTPVIFDLTLNGYSRSANLLTLAFTPPFLAATICLLLALAIVGWRAFVRMGSGRAAGRAIGFGKTALVTNAASFLQRTGRLHLVAEPYLHKRRLAVARALALSRQADQRDVDTAIDRALARRTGEAQAWSQAASQMVAARSPVDLVQAARRLKSLERTIIR